MRALVAIVLLSLVIDGEAECGGGCTVQVNTPTARPLCGCRVVRVSSVSQSELPCPDFNGLGCLCRITDGVDFPETYTLCKGCDSSLALGDPCKCTRDFESSFVLGRLGLPALGIGGQSECCNKQECTADVSPDVAVGFASQAPSATTNVQEALEFCCENEDPCGQLESTACDGSNDARPFLCTPRMPKDGTPLTTPILALFELSGGHCRSEGPVCAPCDKPSTTTTSTRTRTSTTTTTTTPRPTTTTTTTTTPAPTTTTTTTTTPSPTTTTTTTTPSPTTTTTSTTPTPTTTTRSPTPTTTTTTTTPTPTTTTTTASSSTNTDSSTSTTDTDVTTTGDDVVASSTTSAGGETSSTTLTDSTNGEGNDNTPASAAATNGAPGSGSSVRIDGTMFWIGAAGFLCLILCSLAFVFFYVRSRRRKGQNEVPYGRRNAGGSRLPSRGNSRVFSHDDVYSGGGGNAAARAIAANKKAKRGSVRGSRRASVKVPFNPVHDKRSTAATNYVDMRKRGNSGTGVSGMNALAPGNAAASTTSAQSAGMYDNVPVSAYSPLSAATKTTAVGWTPSSPASEYESLSQFREATSNNGSAGNASSVASVPFAAGYGSTDAATSSAGAGAGVRTQYMTGITAATSVRSGTEESEQLRAYGFAPAVSSKT